MKPSSGAFAKSIIDDDRNVASIIIPTLIRLLLIRIDARSSSGFSRSLMIVIFDLPGFFSRDFMSEGPSEKNATSDPEIKLERKIKIINATIPNAKPVVIG
jgi:hypothetical protein